MSENFDRYTDLFLDEASEQIEELNQNLLNLEREGYDKEIINEIFRTAHTLKSSAAFVGLEDLSNLAHKMEDLLQQVKDEKVTVTTGLVNLFFQCLDRIKVAVAQVSEGRMPEDNFSDLIESLLAYGAEHGGDAPVKAPAKAKSASVEASSKPVSQVNEDILLEEEKSAGKTFKARPPAVKEKETPVASGILTPLSLRPDEERELAVAAGGKKIFDGIVHLDSDAPMKNMRLLLLVQLLKKAGNLYRTEPVESKLEDGERQYSQFRFIYFGDRSREDLSEICQVDSVDEVRILEHGNVNRAGTSSGQKKREGISTEETHVKTKNIKVSSEKIDYLLNSVGELVITNSGLLKIYEDLHDEYGDAGMLGELKTKIDQAARIARDLQSGIMKTRMIPVELVFQRFTRPVRDLALELGKEVDLKFQGEETELDKNIIDALNDPLLHLVRNALDHGIEAPEDRVAAGKDARATLLLNAFQSGNNIFVEIRDDGRGLNRDAILRRAVERGLVPDDSMLPDEEIYNLIFHPGFSTAQQVTDVSGRGVGMNVVKKMVQEFKGNIQIHNDPGNGCSFILSFPLTLAIISSILVKVDAEEYAFPLSDVVETIKVNRDDITTLQGKDIINLRGDILPVFQLRTLMGFPYVKLTEEFPVVIANVNNRKIGFIVNHMVGKQEIVIKPIEQNFRTVRGLIGACLMGDGSIVMVLDVQGLLDIAQNEDVTRMLPGVDQSGILDATKIYNQQVSELSGALRRNQNQRGRKKKKGVEEADETEAEELREYARNGKVAAASVSAPAASGAQMSTAVKESPVKVEAEAAREPAAVSGGGNGNGSYVEPVLHKSVVTTARQAGVDTSEDIVKSALDGFEEERKERVRRAQTILSSIEDKAMDNGSSVEEEISDDDYAKLYSVINTGMINAGFVLSQLLGVSVEVSVPEFKTIAVKDLAEYIPGDRAIFVTLETVGDFQAMIALVFDELNGTKAASDLMGQSLHDSNVKPDPEEVQSVLSELTNIVGSSILNALANKTGLSIAPSVPSYSSGESSEFIHGLQSRSTMGKGLRAIYISADFFREDMELLGRVFLLPSRPTLSQVIGKL